MLQTATSGPSMCEIAAVKRRPLNDALDGLRSWRIGPVRNWLAREREIRERRVRLLTEALLAGVAVAGISGLASLVQAGYALGPLPTIALVVSVVLLSCLIGVWVWRSSQQN